MPDWLIHAAQILLFVVPVIVVFVDEWLKIRRNRNPKT